MLGWHGCRVASGLLSGAAKGRRAQTVGVGKKSALNFDKKYERVCFSELVHLTAFDPRLSSLPGTSFCAPSSNAVMLQRIQTRRFRKNRLIHERADEVRSFYYCNYTLSAPETTLLHSLPHSRKNS